MSQSSSNILMPALAAAAVVAAVVIGVLYLGGQQPDDADGTPDTTPLPQIDAGEAPDIQAVDIDRAPVADVAGKTGNATGAAPASAAPDLFASNGRRRALRDGLSSDDAGAPAPTATAVPDAEDAEGAEPRIVDFFDYGQLDKRLRIGVFGRGAIPRYRVRHIGRRYIIDMPGQYQLRDNARNRRLAINALGIDTAELFATNTGIRMVIETERQPRHSGFLIEDPRGIMIAFEPRP